MIEEQQLIVITPDQLQSKVEEMKQGGYRLVQIGCTQVPGSLEINYSFDKAYTFINLRIVLSSEKETLPSMSSVYLSAFLYENEIHDLYGVTFSSMAVDYQGNFYRTAVKKPFLNVMLTPEKKEGAA
jgi:ech hydrogenase subunit D